jgi:hypothetical protein
MSTLKELLKLNDDKTIEGMEIKILKQNITNISNEIENNNNNNDDKRTSMNIIKT